MEDNNFDDLLPPVPDQKTLVLVNTFVIHTAGLLNRFSSLCERKLEAVDRSMKRVDIQLKLLESKLRSVEGIEHVKAAPLTTAPAASSGATEGNVDGNAEHNAESNVQAPPAPQPPLAPAPAPLPPPSLSSESAPPPSLPIPPVDEVGPTAMGAIGEPANTEVTAVAVVDFVKMRDHHDYGRFFRMEKMGVPTQAVKNRMALEDINPALLDAPDAPAYPT